MQFSALFSTLALAAAAALPRGDAPSLFSIVTIHSGSTVHLQTIGTIYGSRADSVGITKDTSSQWQLAPGPDSSGNYLKTADSKYVEIEGNKLITDSTYGSNGFAINEDGDLTYKGGQPFQACPTGNAGEYYLEVSDGQDCDGAIGVKLHTEKSN